jgi:hypothetical protein
MDLYDLSAYCFGWSIWLCELNCLVTYVASGGNLAQDFQGIILLLCQLDPEQSLAFLTHT